MLNASYCKFRSDSKEFQDSVDDEVAFLSSRRWKGKGIGKN